MNLDNDLVQKMHDLWKDARGDDRREHLGASVIGRECDREIWYGFRWAKTGAFDGRMLRLFDRGKREEIVVLFELASCGIKIRNEDGVQERFSDHGGHFCGSPDAIGVKDGRAFVVEIKTANDKSWNDLHKNGVAESKPEHFCQMQVYMGEMKIPKALYISVNKNTDEIHAEWVEFDKDAYNALRQRARELIFSAMPPRLLARIGRPWKNASWITIGEFSHQTEGITIQSTERIRLGISRFWKAPQKRTRRPAASTSLANLS